MAAKHVVTIAAAALGGLLAGSAARAATTPTAPTGTQQTRSSLNPGMSIRLDDAATDKHDCAGKNSCKGNGGCKTGDQGCKGKNSCKGKGGCSTNK